MTVGGKTVLTACAAAVFALSVSACGSSTTSEGLRRPPLRSHQLLRELLRLRRRRSSRAVRPKERWRVSAARSTRSCRASPTLILLVRPPNSRRSRQRSQHRTPNSSGTSRRPIREPQRTRTIRRCTSRSSRQRQSSARRAIRRLHRRSQTEVTGQH